ncbi:MAG: hypothetical protein ACLQVI_30075 [Polyangiaceae bacterium]
MARNAPDDEIADLRGRVYDAISMARLDIASTVAHLACEAGRASEMAGEAWPAARSASPRWTRTGSMIARICSELVSLMNYDLHHLAREASK